MEQLKCIAFQEKIYMALYKEIPLSLISPELAHFQALLTVSTPATSLNICNTEKYNDNHLTYGSFYNLLYNVQSYVELFFL